jgi:hypothetical protein
MAAAKTARHRALVAGRSMRRLRQASKVPSATSAAIQVFISRLDHFLGTELFAADEPVVIGRHREVLLRLKDPNISREHAAISLEAEQLWIEDLGSANGTLINGRRIAGKIPVLPADAIQIGAFTLRLRALLPHGPLGRPSSGISEADTKVEAVLSVESSKGTGESAVEISEAIDWRLYEDAVRRATGAEPARNVIHLRLVEGEAPTLPGDREHLATNRDPAPPYISDAEPNTSRNLKIDTQVAQRIEELDRAVERLRQQEAAANGTGAYPPPSRPSAPARDDTKPERSRVTPEPVAPRPVTAAAPVPAARPKTAHDELNTDRRYPSLPIRDDEQVWSNTPSSLLEIEIERAASRPFQIVPSDPMASRERDAMEIDTNSSREPEEIHETEIEAAESLPPSPMPAELIAQSLLGRAGSPEESMTPAPRPSTGGRSRIPARLVTPTDPPRSAAAKPKTSAPPPLPNKADPRSIPPPIPKGKTVIPAPRHPDAPRRPTPPPPPPPSGLAPRVLSGLKPVPLRVAEELRAVPRSDPAAPRPRTPLPPMPSETQATEQVPEADLVFDAVEIAARANERLLDIATLRREGEQYVLGHRTPQGALAPPSNHAGLRLLRITQQRFVDLVFPGDVAGHLVRDGETVMLRELTESRKYSCLRLKARDVATVILGSGPAAISYHIRFLRAPRAVTRAR